MLKPLRMTSLAWLLFSILLSACYAPNPQPQALTPIPTLAPGETATLNPAIAVPSTIGGVEAPPGEGSAAVGAQIYMKNCSPCHGNQGQGVDAPPLRNSLYIQTAGLEAITTAIQEGRPGTEMPAWLQANGGPFTEADIQTVVAFLTTLQGVSNLPPTKPESPEPTESPLPPGGPTPEPARPSEPGEPGLAATLVGDARRGRSDFGLFCAACHGPEGVQGVPNPGSDDGVVPELNPIDPTIADPDSSVFAANIDLFIEHGSVPEGSNPTLMMPPFGDAKMLADQQIADLIAYLLELNQP